MNRIALAFGPLARASATILSVSMGLTGCVSFPSRRLDVVDTAATGSEGALARTPRRGQPDQAGPVAALRTEPVPTGAYLQVSVDAVCFSDLPSKIARDGGSDYFVGSLVVTAAGDDDDPVQLHRAAVGDFGDALMAASDGQGELPATVVRLAAGEHRCVPQDHLLSLPEAVHGDRPRHEPRVTFTAAWLRGLRRHDIRSRMQWVIALGRRLLELAPGGGVVGGALETLVDDQREWIDFANDLADLRSKVDIPMLASFTVPLAEGEAGTSTVRVPAADQRFVALLVPPVRTPAVQELVASGRLRFVNDRVAAIDASLGCERGASTCPFQEYVVWHVEHANDASVMSRPAFRSLADAANEIREGRWTRALVALEAFDQVVGSGVLRGYVSSDDRARLVGLSGLMRDAAQSLHPEPGQLTEHPCAVLGRIQQYGLIGQTATGLLGHEGAESLVGGMNGVVERLRASCGQEIPVCDGVDVLFSDESFTCEPRVGCPAGAVRSNGRCECPNGARWDSIAQTCASACAAGFVANGASCVPTDGGGVAALPSSRATPAASSAPAGTPAAQLQQACEGGNADACNRLGRWYAVGYGGLARDEARAFGLYRRACDGGSRPGCNNVAAATRAGRGTASDPAAATVAFRRLCEGGHLPSCVNLANDIRTSAAQEAFGLYQRGCDGGVTEGCRGLSYMWSTGCDPQGPNASLPMCDALSAADRNDVALRLALRACGDGDGMGCREGAALLHMHPELAGGETAAHERGRALLYQGCQQGSAQACFDYASTLQSSWPDDAARLREWACGRPEGRPSACGR